MYGRKKAADGPAVKRPGKQPGEKPGELPVDGEPAAEGVHPGAGKREGPADLPESAANFADPVGSRIFAEHEL